MTLKDIAAMAGVSVATVSYVMNGKDHKVSAEVAERVRGIIREMDYQPNTIAKSLRSSRSTIFGVLTEDLSVWQVGKIVQGITHYTEACGYSVVISDLAMKEKIGRRYDDIYRYREQIDKAAARLKSTQVGGIIFLGMHDRSVSGLFQTDLPVVYAYCSTDCPQDVQIDYDNSGISRRMVERLLKRFGNRIGIIDGPSHSAPARLRMAGVREAYRQAGVSPDPKRIAVGDWEYESGAEACRAILDGGGMVRAIYAFNDLMALGAIRELKGRGLRVPEDVSVAGFDDIPFGEYADPPLTTVHVPLEEIGYESAASLAALLEGQEKLRRQICLDCRFVERVSCPL